MTLIVPLFVGVGFMLFILAYTLYSFYAVHHLNEFGYSGHTSQQMLRIYVLFTAVIIVGTVIAVSIGFATL